MASYTDPATPEGAAALSNQRRILAESAGQRLGLSPSDAAVYARAAQQATYDPLDGDDYRSPGGGTRTYALQGGGVIQDTGAQLLVQPAPVEVPPLDLSGIRTEIPEYKVPIPDLTWEPQGYTYDAPSQGLGLQTVQTGGETGERSYGWLLLLLAGAGALWYLSRRRETEE